MGFQAGGLVSVGIEQTELGVWRLYAVLKKSRKKPFSCEILNLNLKKPRRNPAEECDWPLTVVPGKTRFQKSSKNLPGHTV